MAGLHDKVPGTQKGAFHNGQGGEGLRLQHLSSRHGRVRWRGDARRKTHCRTLHNAATNVADCGFVAHLPASTCLLSILYSF